MSSSIWTGTYFILERASFIVGFPFWHRMCSWRRFGAIWVEETNLSDKVENQFKEFSANTVRTDASKVLFKCFEMMMAIVTISRKLKNHTQFSISLLVVSGKRVRRTKEFREDRQLLTEMVCFDIECRTRAALVGKDLHISERLGNGNL
jgi:hypothetical protein